MGVWLIYAILSAFIDSLNFTFCKSSINGKIDPILALFIRTVVMAAVLSVITFSLKKFNNFSVTEMFINYKPWANLYAAGVLSAFSYLCYFIALKYGAESRVNAVDQLTYVFVLLLAIFFLKESFSMRTFIGSALILAGAYLSV